MSPLELTLRTLGRAACLSPAEIDKLISEFCPTVTIDVSAYYSITITMGEGDPVFARAYPDITWTGLDMVEQAVRDVAKALGARVETTS